MMEYKGYFGKVDFDADAQVFHGEVINLRDVITFEADNVDALISEFHDSVDDYLDFCQERGEEPDKPFSGRFVLRIDSELHKSIFVKSKLSNKSLNTWIAETLKAAVTQELQEAN